MMTGASDSGGIGNQPGKHSLTLNCLPFRTPVFRFQFLPEPQSGSLYPVSHWISAMLSHCPGTLLLLVFQYRRVFYHMYIGTVFSIRTHSLLHRPLNSVPVALFWALAHDVSHVLHQHRTGLPEVFAFAGNPLSSQTLVHRHDGPFGIHDHDAVLNRINHGFPIFVQFCF